QRLDGRNLTTAPGVLSGLNVMRRAFVPNAAGEGYACFLEYLENPTGTDISVTATVWGNLGSDNDTTITATSSGDTQFTTADRWVCSSDGPAAHDPALNFNYWGAGAAVTPSAADLPAGQVDYHVDFPVTVPAMSTVVLMHLCGRNADNAAAAANAAAIDALTPASVLMGLNANRAAVVNWNIPPDDLDVAPGTSFDSAGKQGGPFTPNSQNYTLTNNGVAAIAWTASASEPWLTLSGLGGTIPAAGSAPVTVSHVPAQVQVLAPGDYSAVVTFTNVTSGAQFLRNVSLTVTPRLVVRCNGLFYDALGKLVFNGPVGGDFYPPGEQYEVKNTDDVAIAWTTTFPAWLNVGPSSSGTLNPGESVDVFIVRVPANINALPLGDHADVVRFNDVTHSTFVEVDVEAQVRDIVFVDAGASGDGSSWGSALGTIQAGIDAAALATPPSLVFVKTGVYAEKIAMRADVEVFGGCAGTEADLVDRGTPIPMDGTVIDGSAAGTVVTYTGVTDAGLDGCQVSNGYADGSGGVLFDGVDHTNYLRLCAVMNNRSQRRAAGICALNSAEPVIYYTFVLGNASDDAAGREFGGGICCYESNPHIVQCSIFANAGRYGGGIGLVESSPDILNCLICANSATYFDGGAGGGGIFAHGNSSPIVTNCLIAGNYCVDWNAGALYCQGQSMPVLTNCTISSNSGNNGASGGIVINTGSNTTLINCIVEDLSGTALIEEDPRFGFPENESDFIVRNCLFAGNDAGDISDFTASVRTVYTGGDVIDASVDFAQDNVAGGPDPQFVPNLTGQWTSAPTYNPVTNRTTLTTSGSPFAVPLSVALVNADTSQCRLALVYSNTANTIDVVGDITTATGPHGYADNGDSFELLDFHLNGNSPCINVGDNTAPNLLDT
ncbi:MAG: hypothetical protein QG656_285, partial [Candidatus Hydrogenedentes bacterium]|nr:hypothetical protein [Candidatus Hydrogenedentota bacterium]